MGFALAEAAAEAGAKVTLITGPVNLSTPDRVERIDVISADQMLSAAQQFAAQASIFIAAAAVADFRPSAAADQKIKKTSDIETMQLDLVKNPDILKSVAESEQSLFCVGFAAETENLLAHARAKLARKGLNMIVVNDVSRSDIGFAADDNEVVVITPKDAVKLEKANKRHLARRLIQLIAEQVSPVGNSDSR